MINHVKIQNFRSFVDAEVDLRPFSLVIGANGSGKSNFLKFFEVIFSSVNRSTHPQQKFPLILLADKFPKHQNWGSSRRSFSLRFSDGNEVNSTETEVPKLPSFTPAPFFPLHGREIAAANCPVYNINPGMVSAVETPVPNVVVKGDGSGTAQVLDVLKNGDKEDLFDAIECNFRRYIPEIEKLSLRTVSEGKKQIQVRERNLKQPVSADLLSEGTRIILAVLTILHQENPPPVILLEDIDRGMHPRIFEHMATLMQDIAERANVNILATTHNPYLVDCFQDEKEAVIVVEKKDSASTLSTLASRLEGLDYDKIDPDDMPLGNLWFSGFVGGVPNAPDGRLARSK